jgi:hypothetical protein
MALFLHGRKKRMLKLGIRINRKQIGKAVMAHEEAEQKKGRLAQFKKAVNRICGEYPKKDRWKILNGLSPCFFTVETQKGPAMEKSIFKIKKPS